MRQFYPFGFAAVSVLVLSFGVFAGASDSALAAAFYVALMGTIAAKFYADWRNDQ